MSRRTCLTCEHEPVWREEYPGVSFGSCRCPLPFWVTDMPPDALWMMSIGNRLVKTTAGVVRLSMGCLPMCCECWAPKGDVTSPTTTPAGYADRPRGPK